jgi:hypothetical protein
VSELPEILPAGSMSLDREPSWNASDHPPVDPWRPARVRDYVRLGITLSVGALVSFPVVLQMIRDPWPLLQPKTLWASSLLGWIWGLPTVRTLWHWYRGVHRHVSDHSSMVRVFARWQLVLVVYPLLAMGGLLIMIFVIFAVQMMSRALS